MYSVWFSGSAVVWGFGEETQITDYLSWGWAFSVSSYLFSPLHLKFSAFNVFCSLSVVLSLHFLEKLICFVAFELVRLVLPWALEEYGDRGVLSRVYVMCNSCCSFCTSHEPGLESNDINLSQSSSQATGCVCTLVHYDVTLMTIVTSQISSWTPKSTFIKALCKVLTIGMETLPKMYLVVLHILELFIPKPLALSNCRCHVTVTV
jgi:hypothetical protein